MFWQIGINFSPKQANLQLITQYPIRRLLYDLIHVRYVQKSLFVPVPQVYPLDRMSHINVTQAWL